jgi:hypothetical protein
VAKSCAPEKPEFNPGAPPASIGGKPRLYRQFTNGLAFGQQRQLYQSQPQIIAHHRDLLAVKISAMNHHPGFREN